MTFCSRYLDENVETKSTRSFRNEDEGSRYSGRVMGMKIQFQLDPITIIQAHRYMLANTNVVTPYIE